MLEKGKILMSKTKSKKSAKKTVSSNRKNGAAVKTSEAGATLKTIDDRKRTRLFLFLSFIIPVALLGTSYALHGVYPFGDQQILVTDFWQQYFPFLNDLQIKLQEGSSLLYSWEIGMGTNFVSLAAYYLASPLNLISIIIPPEFLREALTLFLLIRIGCSGLFTAMFLRYAFKRCDVTLPFFSTLYALCAFTMGYYWNIIWFDSFALMPLVIMGTLALIREGKYRLYVISLALAVITNYYMGLFVCIFTAFAFFGICICSKLSIKQFFKKLGMMAGFTVISLSMTAFITLPAYFNLKLTQSANNVFPSSWRFENTFTDVFGNFTAFNAPNVKEGLPNVYCGFICVILIAVYVLAKKVSAREKIFSISVLGFLILSCNVNVLNYIWHGFHATNMIPYRFSFLISFILVVMAYRAFMLIEDINYVDIIGMGVVSAAVIICAAVGQQKDKAVIGSAVIAACVLLAMFLYTKRIFSKNVLTGFVCAVIVIEMCFNVMIGVDEVRTTTRSTYPDRKATIVKSVDKIEQQDDELFYRVEFSSYYTLNDPPLYGFKGISQFASTANEKVTNFLEGTGLLGWDAGNRYYFAETSPLTHAFCDLKYIIAKNGYQGDKVNWTEIFETDGIKTYKNNRYLSLGFMTDDDILTYTPNKDDPFAAQQQLFTKSTGITDDLFTRVNVLNAGHGNCKVYYDYEGSYGQYNYTPEDTSQASTLNWNYLMPADGTLYAYAKIDNTENLSVSSNGVSHSFNIKRPYIISAGTYKKGDIVSFNATPTTGYSGNADIYVCVLNQDTFDRGYALLDDEKLELTKFDTTDIKGTITAKQNGVMYTSIPYEKGWSVYVDGQQQELKSVADAMCAVELTKGEHEIEFKYSPDGFMPGVVLFSAALVLFLMIIGAEWYFKKKSAKTGAEPVNNEE